MKTNLILRHTLELLILLPSMLYALLPVQGFLRFRPLSVYGAALLSILTFSITGGIFCCHSDIASNTILLLSLPFFLAAYCFSVTLDLTKKLFCFFNACMLSGFCTYYTRLFTAPIELGHDFEPYLVRSSLCCLILAGIILCLFLRTFLRKLPYLLIDDNLGKIWIVLALVSLGITLLLIYINPVSTETLLTGRVREIGMIISVLIPAAILFFYHYLWWVTVHINENTKLAQENQLLQVERKRYEDLSLYIDQTRILRHDFRHHLLVMEQYASTGETGLLLDYLHELEDTSNHGFSHHCENRAVDAIAAHFHSIALQNGTEIRWALSIPEVLPWEASDLCSLFGNLIENAIFAVEKLPQEERKIQVTSQMLTDSMLGLSIENPFSGKVHFDKNGLPKARREHHGTGMLSVASIVSRYHGTLTITAEQGIFSVNILLMK